MLTLIAAAVLMQSTAQGGDEPVDPLRAYYEAARSCFAAEAETRTDWRGVDAGDWIRDLALGWRDQNDPQCQAPMDLIDQHLIPSGLSDFEATMRLVNAQICAGYTVLNAAQVSQPAGLVERCDRFFDAVGWEMEG